MARYGAESATFWGVVFKRAKIWGGCFGYWKIQNGPSVFHIDPLHGLIWPRCKGQFSPKFWYQNSPISVGLNWPQKQYHSGLTRFGPIFGAKLALFILQCWWASVLYCNQTPQRKHKARKSRTDKEKLIMLELGPWRRIAHNLADDPLSTIKWDDHT